MTTYVLICALGVLFAFAATLAGQLFLDWGCRSEMERHMRRQEALPNRYLQLFQEKLDKEAPAPGPGCGT